MKSIFAYIRKTVTSLSIRSPLSTTTITLLAVFTVGFTISYRLLYYHPDFSDAALQLAIGFSLEGAVLAILLDLATEARTQREVALEHNRLRKTLKSVLAPIDALLLVEIESTNHDRYQDVLTFKDEITSVSHAASMLMPIAATIDAEYLSRWIAVTACIRRLSEPINEATVTSDLTRLSEEITLL